MNHDIQVLRRLAVEYALAAQDSVNVETVRRYRALNGLKIGRPPVLVFEQPWQEFSNCEELRLQCEDECMRSYERELRQELYRWKHHRGDYALRPYYCSPIAIHHSGLGVEISQRVINARSGSHIQSHAYDDVLYDEKMLDKVKFPEIWEEREETERSFQSLSEVFEGLLPVKKVGLTLYLNSWDVIGQLRGMTDCLTDLYDNPDFLHAIMEKLTQIHLFEMKQYERLNLYDGDAYYVHTTPACTDELPMLHHDEGRVQSKDVWCRAMAQPLAVVSPEMLEEFDLRYTARLFEQCGLSYYGCCEPLDNKIDVLRKLPNLRRISITPWANVDRAADAIQGDYVLSYKSNPAFVASPVFDSVPVISETRRVCEACLRNQTPFEFIIKDISTVSGRPEHLTRWVETVEHELDRYF